MTTYTLDFETRSKSNLKKIGLVKYSLDPSTEILCLAFKKNGNVTRVYNFEPNLYFSQLISDIERGCELHAHNAAFEYYIWNNIGALRCGWPRLNLAQMRCSMARAGVAGLPKGLGELSRALGAFVQKDSAGAKLMLRMCKPDKFGNWVESPEMLNRLYEYCANDVDTEFNIEQLLPELSQKEQALWQLTEEINAIGIGVDVAVCKSVISILNENDKILHAEISKLTDGRCATGRQIVKMLKELQTEGIELENLDKFSVKNALKKTGLTLRAEALLTVRQEISRASVRKFATIIEMTCEDTRVRGLLRYHSASTGRWASQGIQVQNLYRPTIMDASTILIALSFNDYSFFSAMYRSPAEACASVIRNVLVAKDGYEFFDIDYSAIEARVLAWLAGEKETLAAYAMGLDVYKIMASKIYNVSTSGVTADMRFMGKKAELGCLAKGTLVLTEKRGYVPIEKIQLIDNLWNGKTWIKHHGVKTKGWKNVIAIKSLNIESTPEHWFLINNLWQTGVEVAQNPLIPLQISEKFLEHGLLKAVQLKSETNAVSKCAAYAALKAQLESTNYGLDKIKPVLDASNLYLGKEAVTPIELATFVMTHVFERNGTVAITIFGDDVQSQIIKTLKGMAVAEFVAPSNLLEHSWNTLLRWTGLINSASPWTELITMETMNLEIYELLLKKKTISIPKEVFDIENVCAGNRYQVNQVLTHNCGFGMGREKFYKVCKNEDLNITPEFSNTVIDVYRETHRHIVSFWYELENATIEALQNPNNMVPCRKIVLLKTSNYLLIKLPSNRKLYYFKPYLKELETKVGRKMVIHYLGQKNGKGEIETTYGGKLVENVTQAVARDIMADAMLELKSAGYSIVLTVHDEILCEEKNKDFNEFTSIVKKTPVWAKGLPIAINVWRAKRYHK